MKTTQMRNNGMPGAWDWKAACRLGVTAILLGALTSCGTPTVMRPTAGLALIDAAPGGKHEDRLKGMMIVSVNGKSTSRDKATIRPGRNNVKVRFGWTQGSSQEVNLKFSARQNRRYFVKYDPFPPTADQFRGTTEVSNAAETIGAVAYGMAGDSNPVVGLASAVVYSPAIVLGLADKAYRVKETIRERSEPVQYVDVSVISEHHAEGVVRRVRAYPSGRIVSKPWDATSNAPAGSPGREAKVRDRQAAEGGSDGFRNESAR